MLHQKETHNYVTQKPIIQPGVKLESKLKRYICKRCGMEFRNAFLLTNHRNQQVVSCIRKYRISRDYKIALINFYRYSWLEFFFSHFAIKGDNDTYIRM